MRKLICTVALSLMATAGAMAQKANVKAAEKLIGDGKYGEARSLADQTLKHEETQNDPQAWYVAGLVEHEEYKREFAKLQLPNGGADEAKMYKALLGEVSFWERAIELEQLPDAKGKVRNKLTKKIKDALLGDLQLFLNAGNYYINQKQYELGAEAYSKYLGIREMPLFADNKKLATPDTMSMEVAYYTALLSFESKNYDKAISLGEKYKGQDFKKEDIYQIISSSYASKGDTVNFLKSLEQGAALFPGSMYFMGNIVQTLAQQGKTEEAIQALEKAINNAPDNVALVSYMGTLYEQKEEWNKSAEWYKKALAIKADDFSANFNMARSLYNQAVTLLNAEQLDKLTEDKAKGFFKEAVPYFEEAYKQKPDEVYYLFANVCDRLGMKERYEQLMSAHGSN